MLLAHIVWNTGPSGINMWAFCSARSLADFYPFFGRADRPPLLKSNPEYAPAARTYDSTTKLWQNIWYKLLEISPRYLRSLKNYACEVVIIHRLVRDCYILCQYRQFFARSLCSLVNDKSYKYVVDYALACTRARACGTHMRATRAQYQVELHSAPYNTWIRSTAPTGKKSFPGAWRQN